MKILEFDSSGRTVVKTIDSKFSAIGWPKPVKILGRNCTHQWRKVWKQSILPWSKPGFCPFEVRPWVRFSKFWHGETSYLYTNGPETFPSELFTHFGRPTPENYKSVFLTGVWPNGAFECRAIKTWVQSFWGATMRQIFKILTWRDFRPLCQWSRKFPYRIFYPFWAPHGQKLQIGLFDWCLTKWCFWLAYDQNLDSILLTIVRLFPYRNTFDQWCD